MNEKHEQAYEDYIAGMKYQAIADKYGVTINTVKSWKQRNQWARKGVHTKEKVCTQKKGAPYGNQNALGNPGGSAPAKNHNAFTHGLYAKYLPAETLELVESIELKSPIELLWESICIKYAAIIRAQPVMFVKDDEDHTIIKSGESVSNSGGSEHWAVKSAADKQAAFLNAQSKAMTTLNNMIKQYEDMKPDGEAAYRIAKLKSEIGKPQEQRDNPFAGLTTEELKRLSHE
ncbi:MAG: phage terminase small subunit [Oscillospiraceae bacterium]